MKVFFHYCPRGFCNCYLLGTTGSSPEAILIDPGVMDEVILNFIEKKSYILKGVFLTHSHQNHIRGLRSLMRIYTTDIYAMQPKILDFKTSVVHDGDTFQVGAFSVKAISLPGHSADSVIYKIGHFLFTGDAMSAGMFGSVSSPYGAMRQIAKIQNTIFPMRDNCVIFPGHGPPTTLNTERQYNISIGNFQANRNKIERNQHNLELLD